MAAASSLAVTPSGASAQARGPAFMQAVAEAAANDRTLARFYDANGYAGIWTGANRVESRRREDFLIALEGSGVHGLPLPQYDTENLAANMRRVRSPKDLGKIEVELSRLFLRYAKHIQTGILDPADVDEEIVLKVPLRDRLQLMEYFVRARARDYFEVLPPSSREYQRLLRYKLDFQSLVERGGWGRRVRAGKLKLGDSGNQVAALRDRLVAMGYMEHTSSAVFDRTMLGAVIRFQGRHGLHQDGVVGQGTLAELNVSPQQRLASIIVALERERWMNMPLGDRHVIVNLADFRASIIDFGKTTFTTRAVVGANVDEQRSPEFSDVMEHMVINPSWNVPRSITVKEYLPLMQENPFAASHLNILGPDGNIVDRADIDFTQYDQETFPYDLKEPPNDGNALGLVKFMFPNKYNIYLHDTPAKSLFNKESRAFSHGCIRLHEPFEFAYELLRPQTDDPVELFHEALAEGEERIIGLKNWIPVHLTYRTAFTDEAGNLNFRRDVYGRDAKIFDALRRAGVAVS